MKYKHFLYSRSAGGEFCFLHLRVSSFLFPQRYYIFTGGTILSWSFFSLSPLKPSLILGFWWEIYRFELLFPYMMYTIFFLEISNIGILSSFQKSNYDVSRRCLWIDLSWVCWAFCAPSLCAHQRLLLPSAHDSRCSSRDFPSGLVARTPRSQCRGPPSSIPGQGTRSHMPQLRHGTTK